MMVRFTNAFATGVAAVALALGRERCSRAASPTTQRGPRPRRRRRPKAALAKPRREGRRAPAGSKLVEGEERHVARAGAADHGLAERPGELSHRQDASIPYNFGDDSGNRVEYKYKGQGRVVFAVPKWGGNMKVVRVDYDPAEDGN